MSKRTEIKIEIERRTIIRRVRGQGEKVFCAICRENVEMLTTDEAALIAERSSRVIFGWCEGGTLHSAETIKGLLLVCRASLENLLTGRQIFEEKK